MSEKRIWNTGLLGEINRLVNIQQVTADADPTLIISAKGRAMALMLTLSVFNFRARP